MRLIDADELVFDYRGLVYINPYDFQGIAKYFAKQIARMPTIEPKKGRWIDKSNGIEGAWNYCSVCGEQAIDLYDFCPNCGADMREGD